MAWRLVTVKQCNGSPSWRDREPLLYEPALEEKPYRWETEPAFYFLGEILALKDRTVEELTEIHRVKLPFPGCRVIQE